MLVAIVGHELAHLKFRAHGDEVTT
jgi:predicted metal-dependent hydrolase